MKTYPAVLLFLCSFAFAQPPEGYVLVDGNNNVKVFINFHSLRGYTLLDRQNAPVTLFDAYFEPTNEVSPSFAVLAADCNTQALIFSIHTSSTGGLVHDNGNLYSPGQIGFSEWEAVCTKQSKSSGMKL